MGFWGFGDAQTSTSPNPTHTYTSPGTYTITLIVSNLIGSDTLIKTNYITYTSSPAINCTPTTVNHCCDAGVKNFTLNTIDNNSSNGIVGYENFSCSIVTNIKAGTSESVYVKTSGQVSEHVIIWIDLNDDGVFTDSTEQVYYSIALQHHYDSIRIPRIAVYNKSLRMRIATDKTNSMVPTPCGNVGAGQHEDYAVIISEPEPLPNDTTGIFTLLNNSVIKLFPNPASNVVNLETDLNINKIELKNQIGQIIEIDFIKNKNSIDMSRIPNGLYFLTIHTKEGIVNKKIIINGK